MTTTTFFFFFIPFLAIILLVINLIFAPHNPYQEKDSTFECGFHSFLGQNRTQFSISFFIFALLFLLFDLEILLVYPYAVSAHFNGVYGLTVMFIFFFMLTLGFCFELGKNALKIDSRQTITFINKISSLVTSCQGFSYPFINKVRFHISSKLCLPDRENTPIPEEVNTPIPERNNTPLSEQENSPSPEQENTSSSEEENTSSSEQENTPPIPDNNPANPQPSGADRGLIDEEGTYPRVPIKNPEEIIEILDGKSKDEIDNYFKALEVGINVRAGLQRTEVGSGAINDLEVINEDEKSELENLKEIKGIVYDSNNISSPDNTDNESSSKSSGESSPEPSNEPFAEPSNEPFAESSAEPSNEPFAESSAEPSGESSPEPRAEPSNKRRREDSDVSESPEPSNKRRREDFDVEESPESSDNKPENESSSDNKPENESSSDNKSENESSSSGNKSDNKSSSSGNKPDNQSPSSGNKPDNEGSSESPIDYVLELQSTEMPSIFDDGES